MAFESSVTKLGVVVAAADLSTKQFYAAKMTSTGLNLAGAGEPVEGIIQNKPVSGEAVELAFAGAPMAIFGAAVAKGDKLASDAGGKLVVAVSGDEVVATALEAGSLNSIGAVLLKDEGVLP